MKNPTMKPLRPSLLLLAAFVAGCSFPTSEFNLGQPSGTDVPAVDVPAADVPAVDIPAADIVASDVPAADVPAADAPADDRPALDAPGVDAPTDDAPAADVALIDATGDSAVCPTGQTLCAGACVDTNASGAHCGRCDNACSAANAASVCAAGACAFSCNPGFADCDGNAANGCEADLSAPATCGSCLTRCDATNGAASCAAGACAIACAAGYGNCDGNAANGCEANLQTDVARCGSCTVACANTNGAPTCAAGACGIACAAGYGNCDANAANGCEVNTASDVAHCGACNNRCGIGQVCSGGTCVTTCPGTVCSGACVDLATSATNCGACGTVCATANGTPRCVARACVISSCNAGYANCDANVANGCETATQANLLNCGACGNRCAFANAAATCAAGACVLGACAAGFANCDGNAANGCETDLRTNPSNCGACSNRCAPPNAAGTCAAGVCGLGACAAGFANCDANPANGCEVNTAVDATNCGACGNLCRNYVYGGSTSCVASACAPVCNAGYANCDGNLNNGCEASTNTNLNCGGCARACALTCGAAGACAGAAPGAYGRSRYITPPPFVDACAIAGRATYLQSLDDGYVRVTLPFALRFWTGTLAAGTGVNVASNGWFAFDGLANQSYYAMLPDPAAPNSVVAPYFTDLFTSATGVCVATVGLAPNRRFVVEWSDAVFLSDRTRAVTFEAVINESNSVIEFYYDRMAAPPAGQNVAIGVENPAGVAASVVCNPANACGVGTGDRYGFIPP